MSDSPALNIADWESRARVAMDPGAFDYYAGGAGDERTLAANRAAFDSLWLRPRALVDVSNVEPALTLFGDRLTLPVLLAPTAFHRLAHPDGELATARAAAAAGTAMVVSTLATYTFEQIAATGPGVRWMQLYFYRDRGLTTDMVKRAAAAGFRALVLTADTPRLGRRERDLRNAFQLPDDVQMANFDARHPLMTGVAGAADGRTLSNYAQDMLNPALTWKDVEWLRGITDMPVIVKGVVRADDAHLALEHGASGLVVSNHGGRQLDGAIPSIRALPEVAEAAACRVPVLMDGGVRRGADVVKALALGATAVLIGRPFLWGLAAAGEAGVRSVLDLLREELVSAMALCGTPNLGSIGRDLIVADRP
jgi:4-hydroxymandelate oxidase